MKGSRALLALFAAVSVLQLAVPVSQLWRYELTLRAGKPCKFRTAPLDPYDAFRGRYVSLAFQQREAPWEGHAPPAHGCAGFAVLGEDADGFAQVLRVVPSPPKTGDYLRVKIRYSAKPKHVGFSFPFDRFYLKEWKAPEAERLYQAENRTPATNRNSYAVVRVRNGVGVLEDLFVGGKPLHELLSQKAKP